MLSKACQYALKACIYIASNSLKEQRSGLKDIAHEIDSPLMFTAKILQDLARKKVIDSVKGPNGGFYIRMRALETQTLGDIVRAIDGDDLYHTCVLGLKDCSEDKPCSVHKYYKPIRTDIIQMLDQTTLFQVATGIDSGITFLKT